MKKKYKTRIEKKVINSGSLILFNLLSASWTLMFFINPFL